MIHHVDYEALTSGDVLFSSHDAHRMAVACVNFGWDDHGYITGYLAALDVLVDFVLSTHQDQDLLVYPILFSGRQYLELRLKALLRGASRLLERPLPGSKVMDRHALVPLWECLSPLLVRILPDGVDQVELVGQRIREFDSWDSGSFAFRYATDKTGLANLPADVHHIGLSNFRDVMARMAGVLEIFDTAIRANLDAKADYHSGIADG